jgi:hypothetical protein
MFLSSDVTVTCAEDGAGHTNSTSGLCAFAGSAPAGTLSTYSKNMGRHSIRNEQNEGERSSLATDVSRYTSSSLVGLPCRQTYLLT